MQALTAEILQFKRQGSDVPLGVVLISGKKECHRCSSKLYLRGDRPSTVTIYDHQLGTIPELTTLNTAAKETAVFNSIMGIVPMVIRVL